MHARIQREEARESFAERYRATMGNPSPLFRSQFPRDCFREIAPRVFSPFNEIAREKIIMDNNGVRVRTFVRWELFDAIKRLDISREWEEIAE